MPSVRDKDIRKVLLVPREMEGERLDRFLEGVLGITRSQVKRLIDRGFVEVCGARAKKPGQRVRCGDEVGVNVPSPEPSELVPMDMEIKVYHEDEHLAVVEKPAGIPVHPAAGHAQDTFANALIARFPVLSAAGGRDRPGIVHRLDKDTSGLLVIAKTQEAHLALSEMFKKRCVVKVYVALCHGRLEGAGRVEAPIGRHPVDRKRMAVVPAGREAVSLYRVLDTCREASLVAVRILTGRTHQIRVHMHHIGHPVLGDRLYGKKGLSLIGRQALHAAYIRFSHPLGGGVVEAFSPPPEDMVKVAGDLGLDASKALQVPSLW